MVLEYVHTCRLRYQGGVHVYVAVLVHVYTCPRVLRYSRIEKTIVFFETRVLQYVLEYSFTCSSTRVPPWAYEYACTYSSAKILKHWKSLSLFTVLRAFTLVYTCTFTCNVYVNTRIRARTRVRAEALPEARADLKVEVKAREWLIDIAVVCPATKSVVARQYTHVHPGVSAKAGEAVKRNKDKGAGVCGGGRRAVGSCGQEVHRRGPRLIFFFFYQPLVIFAVNPWLDRGVWLSSSNIWYCNRAQHACSTSIPR
jgi:hypothetical protein